MKFGLIIRGQYPQGDDMQLRLREDLEAAKLAEQLGYDLVAKGSHYSSHPFQYIQQIPYLCQVAPIHTGGIGFCTGSTVQLAFSSAK